MTCRCHAAADATSADLFLLLFHDERYGPCVLIRLPIFELCERKTGDLGRWDGMRTAVYADSHSETMRCPLPHARSRSTDFLGGEIQELFVKQTLDVFC
jgi:hypothetical protein